MGKEQISPEKAKQQKEYNDYVKQVTPTYNLWVNMGKAFLVRGIICVIGQIFTEIATNMGANKDDAGAYCTLALVFLSVLLTGLNIYPTFAKFGRAGALVPITGFANSVAAPAVEYQTEGQVFGIGAKIFTIAGPVILYGILTSWALGFCYWMWLLWTV